MTQPSDTAKVRYRPVAIAIGRVVKSAFGSVPAPAPIERQITPAPEPTADVEARRAICAACPHRAYAEPHLLPPYWYCDLCGCPIDGKTSKPKQRCPDKPPRW